MAIVTLPDSTARLGSCNSEHLDGWSIELQWQSNRCSGHFEVVERENRPWEATVDPEGCLAASNALLSSTTAPVVPIALTQDPVNAQFRCGIGSDQILNGIRYGHVT